MEQFLEEGGQTKINSEVKEIVKSIDGEDFEFVIKALDG